MNKSDKYIYQKNTKRKENSEKSQWVEKTEQAMKAAKQKTAQIMAEAKEKVTGKH